MGSARIEILVGSFLIIGFLALGWLALQLGEVPWVTESKSYILNAEFNNISGVKVGADVQIAGVTIGKVRHLKLNEDSLAVVGMQLDRSVTVPVDSVASVKSQGIIGDKIIQITLGGDSELYKPEDTVVDTESAVDLESLISKFAFGQVDK
ncbi:outer membrane lipid asymmetry maintenance protein MlaD [Desulfobulbus oligotrophicus]|jgi:phospholipid/cholesterol/gamma-HCH transport system substrate-binding protein|uniref:Outer membrane lipid asymmetry maintenance protein MlaD n=1 Tax=Desulfobulbus oligotrophicus TaxID=1909699 RepID=A0A7T5VEQ3_9BACT|nr:outer membrane lipid asymmetry maintenance protein MlaD [Desulfobulbus oligotrophicus]MDY0389823.1 outer membrane lipid asymmetry maintenance protein MlaD [Desulfobulbus oligotrophicus]QQG66539.1 outer membrane lipid asymmetry maintenance protein MlaD [Desulfobulbus oligotrophicus]